MATDTDTLLTATARLLDLAHGNLWSDGAPPALVALQDLDLAGALALQLRVLDAWVAEGEQLGGWKIGLTSRTARDSIGTGVRPHGYVLASRVLTSGDALPAGVPHCRLEPEIAVTLGADLAGDDVTVERARAAVATVAPAFEINSNRVPKGSSLAVRLGNALNNWGIVVGAGVRPDAVDLADLAVTIGTEDGAIETGHSGPATLDDPYLSLTRVCRSLALNGRGLTAGQTLITGSLTAAVPVDGKRAAWADFGPLGRVELTL